MGSNEATLALIPTNQFWLDYANHVSANVVGRAFLSADFTQARSSFAEMIMALAVLDLPFKVDLAGSLWLQFASGFNSCLCC